MAEQVDTYNQNLNLVEPPVISSPQDVTPKVYTQAVSPKIPLPDYLKEVYYWSYLSPRNVNWLDREPIVKAILWWQHNHLRDAAFAEINRGEKVLQAAAVYGKFSIHLARKIGPKGLLRLIDVAPIQVKNTREKLRAFSNSRVELADATRFSDGEYDKVLSYFLLHEVPDAYKTKILDNLLKRVKPGGKLVIVDYHRPHWFHPLRPIMSLIFNWLEPFAKAFWLRPVESFASDAEKYNWQTSYFFGGLYQKVVVTLKN